MGQNFNMKRHTSSWYLLFFCALISGCNNSTPEQYFDIAVLNSNMITGFATEGLSRELESPSVKMDEQSKQAVPMQRSELLNSKLQYLEQSFEKLQNLKETPDTKEMLQNSIALYKYVLPVYKTEYSQLARLYDAGGSKEAISSLTKSIHEKYFPQFDLLFTKLIASGKIYAEKHEIKVNWH